MTDSTQKPSENERTCQTCAVSQMGLENIRATGNLLSGANAACITCKYNPGREMFGPILDAFGPATDNWQPRNQVLAVKEPLNTKAPKSKGMKKKK